MALQVRALMYYLARYVEADRARHERLVKHCARHGMKSTGTTLWRNLNLRTDPPAAAFIAYLYFLHREKAIRPPRGKERDLFLYAFPELLRAKKKAV